MSTITTEQNGAGSAISELASSALEQASAAKDSAAAGLQTAKNAIGDGLHAADRHTQDFVEAHPLLSLGLALGAGFLVGRWIARR